MIDVHGLFVGRDFKTEVWLTDKVTEQLCDSEKAGELATKLEHFAKVGFINFEAKVGRPIKYEGNGVYRIGLHASLFRLIGFYENDRKAGFIGVDVFTKGGQKLSKAEKKRIKEVAKVRADASSWRKVPNG